jgi:hypothetical protein
MKISFTALQKQCTIHELFFQSIFETYRSHRKDDLLNNKFPEVERKFFEDIITGRCDLKLVVWKKLQ